MKKKIVIIGLILLLLIIILVPLPYSLNQNILANQIDNSIINPLFLMTGLLVGLR